MRAHWRDPEHQRHVSVYYGFMLLRSHPVERLSSLIYFECLRRDDVEAGLPWAYGGLPAARTGRASRYASGRSSLTSQSATLMACRLVSTRCCCILDVELL